MLHLQSWLIGILPADPGGHVGATVRHWGLGVPLVGAMRELWKVLLRDRQSGGLILLKTGHRRNRRHGMGRAGWMIAESMWWRHHKSGRWGRRLVSGCRCMLCRVIRRVIMVVRRCRRQATGGRVPKVGSVGRDAGHLWIVGGVGRRLSWSRRRIVFGYWDEFAFASLPLVDTAVTRTSGIGGVALNGWPSSAFERLQGMI